MTEATKKTKGAKPKYDNNVALGDILTLIFGFFVLMVTLKQYAIVAGVNVTAIQTVKTSGNGSTLDSNDAILKQPETFITISEQQFERIALGRELFHIPEVIRTSARSIIVQACASSQGIGNGESRRRLWERSGSRAEIVKTLLQSTGIAAERIALRTLGSHCELNSQKNQKKQVVLVFLD